MVFPARPLRGRANRMLHGSYNHSASQISLYPMRLPRDWIRHDGSDIFKLSYQTLTERKKRLLHEISKTAIATLLHELLHVKFERRGLASYVEEPLVRRSEEHTSELQSHSDLVCRLLLEKKKKLNVTERHNQ